MFREFIAAILSVIVLGAAAQARAQQLLRGSGPGGRPLLLDSDAMVLEAQGDGPRRDVNCAVAPDKAVLGFDLKFHTGYSVTIPLKDLGGSGNRLTILFRVGSPAADAPVYFVQHVLVPPIQQPSGDVMLNGEFDLGGGDYHVDWLMRDLE